MVSGVGVFFGDERIAVLFGDSRGCAGSEAGDEVGDPSMGHEAGLPDVMRLVGSL